MGDESRRHPSKKSDFGEFSADLMKKMDEFFYSKPSRNILDSIDTFFQQNAPNSKIPVDLFEKDHEWIMKVDLPGVNKEDIHVDVAGDRVKIGLTNEHELKTQDDKNEYIRRERRFYHSERTVQLPYSVDKRKVKAKFRNGVLEIRGPQQPKNNYRLDIE